MTKGQQAHMGLQLFRGCPLGCVCREESSWEIYHVQRRVHLMQSTELQCPPKNHLSLVGINSSVIRGWQLN